jgi:putative methyltransferase
MPSPARQLTKNLDDLASPYLNGTFDGIMNRGIKFHAIWETNRGCPFQCGFCYWGNQSRALKARASAERIEQEMDWFVKNEINLLYIADSNFGWSDQDIVTAKGLVYCKRKYGFPNKVIVSWAKNATDKCFEVAKILNSASACYPITMSYQSLDKEALKNIKRSNIALDHSKELRQKYRAANLSTYTDLLIGIPGETSESFINGLENIISSGEHDQIQIYPIRILPNTDMAQPEYIKEHKVKTIWTPLQSKHGSLSNDDPVTETEEIIIATSTMPTPDWRMAMEITWFTQSFFCLKSAFFICLFLNLHLGQRIMDFAQFFLQKIRENKNNQFPLLHREMNRVENYLDNFLKGDPMVDTSDLDLLAVRWPIEEVSFIKLSLERKSFYKELQSIVDEFIALKKLECDPKLLNQIFQYQEARIVNLEGPGDTQLIFDYNIPQFFDAAMLLKPIMIKPQSVKIHIEENYHYNNLTEFTQYHVWYGRQGKAFYYKLSYD